ncbi:MAG: diaminopimelate decarboxylase [Armatimonadota bacterium]
MLLGTQKINSKNHLEIGGCDVTDLVAEYGTPLYVMDEEYIRQRCKEFKNEFSKVYGDIAIAYASKAFILTAMCGLIAQEGLWLDVASAGELYTAKIAGFPMNRIVFHGNYKSTFELEMAVEYGVKYIVADSFLELEILADIAKETGNNIEIMIRCNPGVDPHTHRLIRTGQEDSKFGFNIKDGTAYKAAKYAADSGCLDLTGIHCHVGSQLFDLSPFSDAAPVMMAFMKKIKEELSLPVALLDLGGGLGVRYLESHNPPSVQEFAKTVCNAVSSAAESLGMEKPLLMVEPGRSIAGESGTTLYSIGPIKEVPIAEEPGVKSYLAVDGGLSDNPRPALYDAEYSAMVANRAGDNKTKKYTVAGKHCETDILIPSIMLQEAKTGDILAVQTTGAYNHAMASNYNRFTRPAVIFVNNGKAELVYKREVLEDLVRQDILPDRLKP